MLINLGIGLSVHFEALGFSVSEQQQESMALQTAAIGRDLR